MRTRKRLAGVVAIASVSLLVAAACSSNKSSDNGKTVSTSFADCDTKPNSCNGGTTKSGGTLTYAVEKTFTGWNINDAETNTADFVPFFNGILPTVFNVNPDFSVFLNTDLMTSVEETSTSPQTIVYKIKSDAAWDDGTPINADDFTYSWQTQNGKDCKDCSPASSSGYDLIKSVTPSDNGKTVTAVFDSPFLDYKLLFGNLYPAHIAKQHGDLGASWKYFNETLPNFTGGPFKVGEYQKDVS
jgi:peptide/nickel transport system substrate-binding protein